jgi:hypothetical protein
MALPQQPADFYLKEYRNLKKIKKGKHFLYIYMNSHYVMSYPHFCSEVTAVRLAVTLVWQLAI